jgi:hypothetical protein
MRPSRNSVILGSAVLCAALVVPSTSANAIGTTITISIVASGEFSIAAPSGVVMAMVAAVAGPPLVPAYYRAQINDANGRTDSGYTTGVVVSDQRVPAGNWNATMTMTDFTAPPTILGGDPVVVPLHGTNSQGATYNAEYHRGGVIAVTGISSTTVTPTGTPAAHIFTTAGPSAPTIATVAAGQPQHKVRLSPEFRIPTSAFSQSGNYAATLTHSVS